MSRLSKTGRPEPHQSRVEGSKARPERINMSDFRDKLTVKGTDPDYEYRWVKDASENGQRILMFTSAGWDFVTSESGVVIGQSQVYKSDNVGSIIRQPAGEGEYLYLMKILKEWYDEDKLQGQKRIDELEGSMARDTGKEPGQDDLYGSVTITR